MSIDGLVQTEFVVPQLRTASVAGGSCCPVPVEALIVPELEAMPGVDEASADWSSGQVTVRHSPAVPAESLAALLEDLNYPAESWNTAPANAVTNQ